MHFALVREGREMRKTSVEDMKDRSCFGQLEVNGNFHVKLELMLIGEGGMEFSSRFWVDKSGWFRKEGKMLSGSKKCRNCLL